MKRNILSALLIMLGIAYSNAQPGFESFSMNNQLVKDLSGYNWKMQILRAVFSALCFRIKLPKPLRKTGS